MTDVLDNPPLHKQYASSTAMSSRGISNRTSLLPSCAMDHLTIKKAASSSGQIKTSIQNKKMPPGANRTASMAADAALHRGSHSTKLFEACSCLPRERKASSCHRLIVFANRRLAEYGWASQFQVHQTSIRNAIVAPLRNGTFRHLAQISNSLSATKQIDNLI